MWLVRGDALNGSGGSEVVVPIYYSREKAGGLASCGRGTFMAFGASEGEGSLGVGASIPVSIRLAFNRTNG